MTVHDQKFPEIEWRIARQDDLNDVLKLMALYYQIDGLDFDFEPSSIALEQLLADPSLGEAIVIEKGGLAVGYVIVTNGFSLEFGGRYQFLDELFLVESERRKGIGTEAIHFVERRGKERGITSIHLEVADDNHSAKRCYERLGYKGNNRLLWSKRLQDN